MKVGTNSKPALHKGVGTVSKQIYIMEFRTLVSSIEYEIGVCLERDNTFAFDTEEFFQCWNFSPKVPSISFQYQVNNFKPKLH